jgi:hypothetical protein
MLATARALFLGATYQQFQKGGGSKSSERKERWHSERDLICCTQQPISLSHMMLENVSTHIIYRSPRTSI